MKSDTAQRNEILNSNITSKLPFKAWKMSLTSFGMGGVGLLSKRVWRPGRMLARAEHSCVSALSSGRQIAVPVTLFLCSRNAAHFYLLIL